MLLSLIAGSASCSRHSCRAPSLSQRWQSGQRHVSGEDQSDGVPGTSRGHLQASQTDLASSSAFQAFFSSAPRPASGPPSGHIGDQVVNNFAMVMLDSAAAYASRPSSEKPINAACWSSSPPRGARSAHAEEARRQAPGRTLRRIPFRPPHCSKDSDQHPRSSCDKMPGGVSQYRHHDDEAGKEGSIRQLDWQ